MLAEVGLFATLLAFTATIFAFAASLFGSLRGREAWVLSGRNAALLSTVMLTVAVVALETALLRQEYQLSYVWSVSSPDMTPLFRVTSLWGSQAGSLLFWCWLMSLFSAGTILFQWQSQRRLMPYVVVFSMAVLAFFIGISLFIENPFQRYWIVDGQVIESALIPAGAVAPSARQLAESANGLNPLLRHFGMAFHPPLLYLGFVGFLVPFAFAMAALASGDLSTNWIKASRRWTLFAWLTLSLGLILGGRWAYDVLGWGGYWGWDPVENAAFLPWLIGTALLHSVMIQEKRGMLKTWNMFLVIATFSAVIFGTFATRSGLVDSVHSFARSGIGFPMFAFWFTLSFVGAVLIIWRRSRGELRDENAFANLFSRETLFVVNNLVFTALFIAVFWGSFGAPILSELIMDTDITLGREYFERVTPPLFLALYVLMGIAPLSAWGATSFKRLGSALLIPLVLTLASVGLFALGGMASPGALFGYGVVLFAGWVALYETYRAAAARRHSHGEALPAAVANVLRRNPRRYGGYMIHLGITVIGIGVIGSTLFQLETQRTLGVGQSLDLGGYTVRYDSFAGQQVAEDGRIMDIANISVLRDGQVVSQLRPRMDFYPEARDMNTMTIAAAHSTLESDVYVLLVGWDRVSAEEATFKVYVNPLVNLIWWGSLILILGTFLALYPRETLAVAARERLLAGEPAPKGAHA